MLGNGQNVDLYKLFLVVRGKGGYDVVCNGKFWDSVGEESGLNVSVGSSVKLVYSKYLSALDSWLKKVVECGLVDDSDKFGRHLMEFRAEVEELLPSCVKEVKGGLNDGGEKLDGEKLCGADGVKGFGLDGNENGNGGCPNSEVTDRDINESVIENLGEGNEPNGDEGNGNGGCPDSEVPDHEVTESVGNSVEGNDAMEMKEGFDGGKMSAEEAMDVSDVANRNAAGLLSGGEKGDGNDDKGLVFDPSGSDSGSDSSGLKRKRESVLDLPGRDSDSSSPKRIREAELGMLSWVTDVAKNPCDPEVGSIPEMSKWKSYGNQEVWKQVLLFREAVLNTRGVVSRSELRNWKGQQMHPCLYDDPTRTKYNLRERLNLDKRLLYDNSTSSTQSSSDSSDSSDYSDCSEKHSSDEEICVPLGSNHQAEIPDWTGVTTESDSKLLGTRIWPLATVNNRLVIERDPIGKGRQDSCGCIVPGSVECVRFHISEKRAKVALELGAAFHNWNFHMVGEDVRLLWNEEDERRFGDIVLSKPSPTETNWDRIFKAFPTKSRADLLSYYYNVFILRRRAHQNRHSPDKIYSDDDESGARSSRKKRRKLRNSFLLTPKKPKRKRK